MASEAGKAFGMGVSFQTPYGVQLDTPGEGCGALFYASQPKYDLRPARLFQGVTSAFGINSVLYPAFQPSN